MPPSTRTICLPAVIAGICGLGLVLASCSSGVNGVEQSAEASNPPSVSSSASGTSTTEDASQPAAERRRQIEGLSWADGTTVEASVVSVGDAVKPPGGAISDRAAHDLPEGDQLLGVLSDARPVVLSKGLPYTVDKTGKYSLYWADSKRDAATDDTSWSIHGDTVVATVRSGDGGSATTLMAYDDKDGIQEIKDFQKASDSTSESLVLDGGKVYWSEADAKTYRVVSIPLAGGSKKVEAENAGAVYRTDQGVAVLTQEGPQSEDTMNQIGGVRLLDGTELLRATEEFELGGFSGDSYSPRPIMNGGFTLSFSLDRGENSFDVAVLNFETKQAWLIEIPDGRIPLGQSTSGSYSFIAWSAEQMEELGSLGNEAVALDASTGELFAFSPENNFENIFGNDKALAWSTKTSSGSVSFASEILE